MILQEDAAIDLETPTGPMRTYVYRPVAPGRYPGLVLFSEIFQRTGPIRRTAALLAGHGFVVAVPEIFHDLEAPGCVIAYDAAGADRGNADKVSRPVTAYDDDARAVSWTARLGQRDGVAGWARFDAEDGGTRVTYATTDGAGRTADERAIDEPRQLLAAFARWALTAR